MAHRISTDALSRRELLQAAGGVTFSALLPLGNGLFATNLLGALAQPKFTAYPYLQPGTSGTRLVQGKEAMVIAWQTDGTPAKFEVEYGTHNLNGRAQIESRDRQNSDYHDGARVNFVAQIQGLRLNTRYHYRVLMNGETLIEGYFTTRKPRGASTRFVAFGDNSCGDPSDHAIAYYAYQAHPDFVMNTGDNVYNHGLDSEYSRFFFPVYNSDEAGPKTGAPLLRSIPFYSVLANHDLTGNDPRQRQVADFTKHPDSLGYFTNLHLPLNGPVSPTYPLEAFGDPVAVKRFTDCAGVRYPQMGNYSYDYGDAHFLCLDSNVYVDPTDSALQEWIAQDLSHTDAPWKIVVYHHPAFNVGREHYSEQHMRVLAPLLETHGVHVVLNGHEHTYQRTRPIKFVPSGPGAAKHVNTGNRLVPGTFAVDRKFDGKTVTKPDGIVHITTGAGGNDLYDPESNDNPSKWLHPQDDNADYVARFVSNRHSLTVVDVHRDRLEFSQVDEFGKEADQFVITR
jgi:hypothetical protein